MLGEHPFHIYSHFYLVSKPHLVTVHSIYCLQPVSWTPGHIQLCSGCPAWHTGVSSPVCYLSGEWSNTLDMRWVGDLGKWLLPGELAAIAVCWSACLSLPSIWTNCCWCSPISWPWEAHCHSSALAASIETVKCTVMCWKWMQLQNILYLQTDWQTNPKKFVPFADHKLGKPESQSQWTVGKVKKNWNINHNSKGLAHQEKANWTILVSESLVSIFIAWVVVRIRCVQSEVGRSGECQLEIVVWNSYVCRLQCSTGNGVCRRYWCRHDTLQNTCTSYKNLLLTSEKTLYAVS